MCGIAAIFNYRTGLPIDRAELTRIRDYMAPRGPDGFGEWFSPDGRVGLGHRRLAIIDLSPTGAQPMALEGARTTGPHTADQGPVITFNGEIYNYRELRAELEAKGRRFNSQSDTEILLHLYELEGEGMLNKLRGMFAFAIWDERKKGLFLARDPFGIKPLYYSDDGQTLRAASQVKALLAGGHIDTAPEAAGHVGFFLWGHVPAPWTLYRGIRGITAGTSLWVDASGEKRERTYCSIPEILGKAESRKQKAEIGEIREALRSALADTVRHHLIADVPVGIFLSSGLDSTTLTALASESSAALRTVTLGFEEFRGTINDEVPLAEEVAKRYGASHQTIWVRRQDFQDKFVRVMRAMDQPTCDGVNSFFISHAAAQAGLKVALSGLGGDELFGSYPSFREIPRVANLLRPFSFSAFQPFSVLFRAVSAPLLGRLTSPKYAGLLEYGGNYGGAYLLRRGMYMPWELPGLLDPDLVREGWARLETLARLETTTAGLTLPHLRVAALEMTWYMRHQLLRDADWASMDHSLEIRTPFVDSALLGQLAPLLASDKPPSKRDMASTPGSPLPASIFARPKTGFTVPVREWLVQEDADFRAERGLRGWTQLVYSAYTGERQGSLHLTRAAMGRRRESGERRGGEMLKLGKQKVEKGRRVLVFRIGQLGDTIVALPALWALKRHFADAEMTLLCDRHPEKSYVFGPDLLHDSGLFKHFEFYPAREGAVGRLRQSRAMLQLFGRLKKARYDTLVYLSPSVRSRTQIARDVRFFRLAGIKNLIGTEGFAAPPRRTPGRPLVEVPHEAELLLARLAASRIPVPPSGEGCMDLGLGLAEELEFEAWLGKMGGNSEIGRGKIEGGNEDSGERRAKSGDRVPSSLSALPSPSSSWLAFAPGSKMAAKRWPLDRFAEVGRALIDQYHIWPVIFGGPEDAEDAEHLLKVWGCGYNAAGQLSLRAAAQGLKRCLLYIGNDTGTMHLAAAVGTPCVAIFSAREWPGRWYPYGQGHRVLRSTVECEGCGLVECVERKNECLTRISAAEVVAACEAMMGRGEKQKFGKQKVEI